MKPENGNEQIVPFSIRLVLNPCTFTKGMQDHIIGLRLSKRFPFVGTGLQTSQVGNGQTGIYVHSRENSLPVVD